MAIALTGSNQLKTTTTGNLVFDSWTPAANMLTLLIVAKRDETVSVSSVSGNGLTWTLIAEKDAARSQCGVEAWYGLGASPTTGTTTVNLSSTTPVAGVIRQLDGADLAAPEAFEVDTHTATDDNDVLCPVTTITADAWAIGFAVTRSGVTLSVCAGETEISLNQEAGTSGDRVRSQFWYEGPVTTPAATTVGCLDNGGAGNFSDWAMITISVKPAAAAGGGEYAGNLALMGVGGGA